MFSITAKVAALAVFAPTAYPCSEVTLGNRKINVALDVVRRADLIVRAIAVEYAVPPEPTKVVGTVRFKVVEVIRGNPVPELLAEGELVARDDFNDHPVPYQIPRPNALAGACYAWIYRGGGQYLLMMKKLRPFGLTVKWYPLAPVNEQLHSADDPWIVWVRDRALKRRRRERRSG